MEVEVSGAEYDNTKQKTEIVGECGRRDGMGGLVSPPMQPFCWLKC